MSESEAKKSGADLADEATSLTESGEDFDLAEALRNLSPEEAEMFARALDMTLRRRRLLLRGYLAALIALVGGLLAALYLYGSREPGTFVGWVFLIPFASVGIILWFFGRLAKSSRPTGGMPESRDSTADSDSQQV